MQAVHGVNGTEGSSLQWSETKETTN